MLKQHRRRLELEQQPPQVPRHHSTRADDLKNQREVIRCETRGVKAAMYVVGNSISVSILQMNRQAMGIADVMLLLVCVQIYLNES